MSEIRIVLVDSHAIVRQGLHAMLEREAGLRVVGEAGSALAALALVAQLRPDVVLLDPTLSGAGDGVGLDLCGQIASRHPASRVLVLTSAADEWLVLESIRQGAKGYVVKDVDVAELVRSIRAVCRGQSAFDSRSASVLVRWMHSGRSLDSTAQQITAREREVLALLARGMSNVAIGQRLYISAATVKFHVGNVMRKLGTARRAEAVYAATKIGII